MYKFEKRQLRTRLEQAIAKPYDRRKNLPFRYWSTLPVDGEIVKKVGQSVSCNQKSDWSSEELCFCVRAQRVFGNRWTEIQRKDKAVNRFTRLRVKRAKHETMASENNSNNKIMFFLDGSCTPANMKLLLPIEQGSSSIQRHGTVKGTMDVKELVLLLAKNSMNHQSLLLVKDCATPPALKKEVSAAGERDKEGREVGEKKTEGG
ncbi:hypothetical protein HID58_017150 [Brassica napus]|uniref:Uncharacterized protein n=2 Tax=Brassica napus TaxID=3708 RepID=A0ABQ8D685_BRANA|nr:hypothetical protein HID58_017150 [Brassica napus]